MTDATVSYFYTPERDAAVMDRINRGMAGFAAEMREQGIHVGLGIPGVCVTCDQPWPCPSAGL